MKKCSSKNSSTLENGILEIEACCENTLDNLNQNAYGKNIKKKSTWRKCIAKIVHNWKTRSRLNNLSDAQMKDLGLTSTDVYNEVKKPLWK